MFKGLCESICEFMWSSANRDIKYLLCHMTSKSHMIEGSCNFKSGPLYGRSPPCQV